MKNTCRNNCKNGRDCFYLYHDRCKYYHSDYHKKYAKNKKIMIMKERVKIKNEIMNQKIKKEFPIKKNSYEKTNSAKRKKSAERKKSNAIKDLITKESDSDNSDYSSDNSDYSNDYLNYYSNDNNICYITEWRSKYKKTCEHCSSEGCQECIYRFKQKIPISIPPGYIRERRPCLVCGTIPDDRNIWCNNCHNWL